MKRMTNKLRAFRWDKFIFAFLFISPCLDIVNGFLLWLAKLYPSVAKIASLPITPSLAVRLCFLGLVFVYALLFWERRAIVTATWLVAICAISSAIAGLWFVGRYNIFVDFQYMARYLYNIIMLLVVPACLTRRGELPPRDVVKSLQKVFTWSAIVIGGSIIFCYLFTVITPLNLGFVIADRFGPRGYSGFYNAGNEAAAMLTLVFPICIYNVLTCENLKKSWITLLAPALAANAMFLLGTKTALMGMAMGLVGTCAYFCVTNIKKIWRPMALLFGALILMFALLSAFGLLQTLAKSGSSMGNITSESIDDQEIIEKLDGMDNEEKKQGLIEYLEAPPIVRLLLSGRHVYFMHTGKAWIEGGPLSWFFGVGRSSQGHTVEMDLFEILFYYGIIGAIIMLAPLIYFLRRVWLNFWRNRKSALAFCVLLCVMMGLFSSVIAGHVLFTVTGGFYFALVIIAGELYFSKSQPT
ncbi:hypothetical protein FACS1894217_02220 [Clostridia bacterium]|nr:hypothetical protein FACS1894217_02220 [Clostridia bacterium]